MHEYSIVQDLMDRVHAQARAHKATAVHRVSLRIGEESGVDVGLLTTAFETIRTRSICERATLAVTSVPAKWACRACAADVPRGSVLECPRCGAPARLVSGDEIMLERIEMEVGDV